MAAHPSYPYHRLVRGVVAAAAFLLGFVVLLAVVSRWYLVPAFAAAAHATPSQKLALAAHARLILTVVLFVLLVGLFLSFRIGRSFSRGTPAARTQTKYVDAWAESGRRMETPPREQ